MKIKLHCDCDNKTYDIDFYDDQGVEMPGALTIDEKEHKYYIIFKDGYETDIPEQNIKNQIMMDFINTYFVNKLAVKKNNSNSLTGETKRCANCILKQLLNLYDVEVCDCYENEEIWTDKILKSYSIDNNGNIYANRQMR